MVQLAITICVMALIIVTTLGGSGGAPWVFFTYRTLLLFIAILGAIGSWRADQRIRPIFLGGTGLVLTLMLVAFSGSAGLILRVCTFGTSTRSFTCAFLGLANYARNQSAKWKGLLLAIIVVVDLSHLLPDLILRRAQVVGFSHNNANYFATFLLIGLAVAISVAVFATDRRLARLAAVSGAVILFGVIKTSFPGSNAGYGCDDRARRNSGTRSNCQTCVADDWIDRYRNGGWSQPCLCVRKLVDRGEIDPYNYARTEIWRSSLDVIARDPILGVGFGQYFHMRNALRCRSKGQSRAI